MKGHKDFEIWQAGANMFCFKIDYWGFYTYPTLEQAQQAVERQRFFVQRRLEEIEKLNQQYYAQLAEQEQKLKQELRKAREHKQLEIKRLNELDKATAHRLVDAILNSEMNIEDIVAKFHVSRRTIAQIKSNATK